MNKLHLKEGQTYICTKSDTPWWTRGKEYKAVSTNHGKLCLVDDDGDSWYLDSLKYDICQFKLKETPSFNNYDWFSRHELPDEKEKSLDLNKLTVYQLKEYIDLQQALEFAEKELDLKLAKKEVAKYELDEFIERMI
jgi:hypothetical protein